ASKKNPAIVWWDRQGEDETATYFWLYIEDHVVEPESSSAVRLIFPQDDDHAGLVWYQNDDGTKNGRRHHGYLKNLFLTTNQIDDAYWTVGVVEAELAAASWGAIHLRLSCYCPNHAGYELAREEKGWEPVEDANFIVWQLKSGTNRLKVRSVSHGAVKGPETVLLLGLD